MISYLIPFLTGIISFAILDYTWLSRIAKNIYLEKLGNHVTLENGSLVPYLPAVPLVYLVALVGIFIFVLPKASSLGTAFFYGAVFGFILYSFYDFTNLATLKEYPWSITIIDVLWGTFISAVVTTIIFYVKTFLS